MASGRSRGHGPVRGSFKGERKYWLDIGHKERRQRHAEDFANAAVGQYTTCKTCGSQYAKCLASTVTEQLGATSTWRCEVCGHQFPRHVSPEKMEQYYREDLQAKLDKGKVPEVHA